MAAAGLQAAANDEHRALEDNGTREVARRRQRRPGPVHRVQSQRLAEDRPA
jgi:hypothetical protein